MMTQTDERKVYEVSSSGEVLDLLSENKIHEGDVLKIEDRVELVGPDVGNGKVQVYWRIGENEIATGFYTEHNGLRNLGRNRMFSFHKYMQFSNMFNYGELDAKFKEAGI